MSEMEEKLEKLRSDDINFFAKRYVELFAKDFDKTTPEQMQQFEEEIKNILYENAPIYIVADDRLSHGAAAESRFDKIILSSYNFDDRGIRIHELVHSYNHINKKYQGLRDFEHHFVLKALDEGSTEMIAQLIMENEKLENPQSYSTEVELVNFLTHLVGEKIMLQATRGNPQLLSQEVDRILGTTNFLKQIEIQQSEYDDLLSQSWGEDSHYGTKIDDSIKIMSNLKLEVNRGKDIISMLYDAIEKKNDPELRNIFYNVDNEYGYNYTFLRSIRKQIDFNPNEPTMASVQQEMILKELDSMALESFDAEKELKKELLKFLYDQIDFQKYFLDKTNYEYGTYNLTPEDINYCENFKSSLDGSHERLGGQLGITGVGNRVNELNNVIFRVNQEYARQVRISELGFEELLDKRLEIISEQLLIAQQKEILREWRHYIKNTYLSEEFDYFEDDILDEIIDNVQKELEEKEKSLFDKYRRRNSNEELRPTLEQSQPIQDEQQKIERTQSINIDKKYIEKLLNTHLDILRGYQHQIVNGQEMYMPVLKTAQELSQEQGKRFQQIEELYDNGDLDFVTKRAIQAQLSKEFDILREKVAAIKEKESKENEQSLNNDQSKAAIEHQAEAMIEAMANGMLDINGQPIANTQEQLTNNRQMGYAKVWILGILAILISIGIIILGVFITK